MGPIFMRPTTARPTASRSSTTPKITRHPTWWHARDYGLFSANPFGWHDFEPLGTTPPQAGAHTLPPGGTLTLRYRLVFHRGDEKAAKIAERYAEYAAGK